METKSDQENSTVFLTKRAALKVKEIIEENYENQEAVLRVAVKGGGCAGFEYTIQITEGEKLPGDKRYDSHGIIIIVDAMSSMYLLGEKGSTEIDYVTTELMGAGFKFNNPNISATCGCGSSFSA